MNSIVISVPTPPTSYTIYLGDHVLSMTGRLLQEHHLSNPCLIITNPTVANLHLQILTDSLASAEIRFSVHQMPDGEIYKTMQTLESLYSSALAAGLERGSAIVAFGGGVVGDVAGFCAATYMRGVPLVQIPTTLLAQVDSSIGGKVAVDFGGVKNSVGAFCPPRLVISDHLVLRTLPKRELGCGLAEIVKAAVIGSDDLFCLLETGVESSLSKAISLAAAIKAQIVESDPYEKGPRELLNFGHTIGHGLESASGYHLSHGEAVGLGMLAETRLARKLRICDEQTEHRLLRILQALALPTKLDSVDISAAMAAIQRDKKKRRGQLRLALPERIGSVTVIDAISEEDVRLALLSLTATETVLPLED